MTSSTVNKNLSSNFPAKISVFFPDSEDMLLDILDEVEDSLLELGYELIITPVERCNSIVKYSSFLRYDILNFSLDDSKGISTKDLKDFLDTVVGISKHVFKEASLPTMLVEYDDQLQTIPITLN